MSLLQILFDAESILFDAESKKNRNLCDFLRRSDENVGNLLWEQAYNNNFFKPFSSFVDAKRSVKSLIGWPIINFSLALHEILNILTYTILGLANIAIGIVTLDMGEFKNGFETLMRAMGAVICAIYYAMSIIGDTEATLICLLTRSLATVAFGVYKTGEAISECFTSAPSKVM